MSAWEATFDVALVGGNTVPTFSKFGLGVFVSGCGARIIIVIVIPEHLCYVRFK